VDVFHNSNFLFNFLNTNINIATTAVIIKNSLFIGTALAHWGLFGCCSHQQAVNGVQGAGGVFLI
jgi:hypothetical protein